MNKSVRIARETAAKALHVRSRGQLGEDIDPSWEDISPPWKKLTQYWKRTIQVNADDAVVGYLIGRAETDTPDRAAFWWEEAAAVQQDIQAS